MEEKQEAPKNLPAAETKPNKVPEVHVKSQLFCCPQGHDSGVVECCSAVKPEWKEANLFSFSFFSVQWEWRQKMVLFGGMDLLWLILKTKFCVTIFLIQLYYFVSLMKYSSEDWRLFSILMFLLERKTEVAPSQGVGFLSQKSFYAMSWQKITLFPSRYHWYCQIY